MRKHALEPNWTQIATNHEVRRRAECAAGHCTHLSACGEPLSQAWRFWILQTIGLVTFSRFLQEDRYGIETISSITGSDLQTSTK